MINQHAQHDAVFNAEGIKAMYTQRDWKETIDLLKLLADKGQANNFWYAPRYDKDFHGVRSAQEALELAESGWPEGKEKLSATIDDAIQLPALKELYEETIGYDVCGYELDIPEYLAGSPEYFVAAGEERTTVKKTISIVLNAGYYCAWKAEQIFNRGAALCAVVDALEANGRDVEIIAGAYFHGGGGRGNAVRLRNVVKKAGEQFDLSRTAFALGHPAMFRVIGFAEMGLNENKKKCGGSMGGHSYHINPSQAELDAEPDTCFLLNSEEHAEFNNPHSFDDLNSSIGTVKQLLFSELKRIGAM